MLKEEYQDDYQVCKMVKKEEDLGVKAEEHSNIFSCPTRYTGQVVIPWMCNSIQYPPLWDIPFQNPLNSLCIWEKRLNKPFIVIKEQKVQGASSNVGNQNSLIQQNLLIKTETVKTKTKKKTYRQNNCKNYVGLLCAGFARTVLTAQKGSEIWNFIKKIIAEKKLDFESLVDQDGESLIELLMNHVYKVMCGKKVRKANRERDFKIRNIKDLQNLWKISAKDGDVLCLTKKVLKEVINFFFESNYYNQWLENGAMTLPNRHFFLSNKEEIQKKFLNPGFYKPKFNRISNENYLDPTILKHELL